MRNIKVILGCVVVFAALAVGCIEETDIPSKSTVYQISGKMRLGDPDDTFQENTVALDDLNQDEFQVVEIKISGASKMSGVDSSCQKANPSVTGIAVEGPWATVDSSGNYLLTFGPGFIRAQDSSSAVCVSKADRIEYQNLSFLSLIVRIPPNEHRCDAVSKSYMKTSCTQSTDADCQSKMATLSKKWCLEASSLVGYGEVAADQFEKANLDLKSRQSFKANLDLLFYFPLAK